MARKLIFLLLLLHTPALWAGTAVYHYCDAAKVKSSKACEAQSMIAFRIAGCKIKLPRQKSCEQVQDQTMWECKYSSENCASWKNKARPCDDGYKVETYDSGIHNLQSPAYHSICKKTTDGVTSKHASKCLSEDPKTIHRIAWKCETFDAEGNFESDVAIDLSTLGVLGKWDNAQCKCICPKNSNYDSRYEICMKPPSEGKPAEIVAPPADGMDSGSGVE